MNKLCVSYSHNCKPIFAPPYILSFNVLSSVKRCGGSKLKTFKKNPQVTQLVSDKAVFQK